MEFNPINRTISVEEGILEGVPAGDPAFTVFKSIPYAKAPVGQYRWREAVPAEKWKGIRKCDVFPDISIQNAHPMGSFYQKEFFPGAVPMSEDCLYLNIWTPDTSGMQKLPVMFWIHGGAFIGGYSHEREFDGEAFCQRGVILVTIGYRLGALGFFAHPELSARCPIKVSGNYAITDCIQALKWIRSNIVKFGGDPSKITIFGQSAGGAMVQSLLTAPQSKSLFARAIVQSAGGINTLGNAQTLREAEKLGIEVCEKLGKSVAQLFALGGADVNAAISRALSEIKGPGLHFSPVIDGCYQLKAAGTTIAAGDHHDVDIITGSVSGDGGLFGGQPVKSIAELEQEMRSTYGIYADKYLELFNVKSADDLPALSDARKKAGSMISPRGWAFAEIKNDRKPLYIYYFDRKMPGDDSGAFHAAELWYIFGTLDRCWRSMEPGFVMGDYALSRAMSDYWANFAKTGDPNGITVPKWPAFTNDAPVTMYLSEREIKPKDMSGDRITDGMVALQLEAAFCADM